MKKLLLKSMLLLCALIVGSSSVWATETTLTFSSTAGLSALGITAPSAGSGTNLGDDLYSLGGVTLTATDGGTATRVWNKSGAYTLRVYDGGTLTLSVESGNSISSIVFTGTTNFSSIDGWSSSTKTWSGTANSVTFTNTSTQSQIQTITVTYATSDSRTAVSINNISFSRASLVVGSAETAQATATHDTPACTSGSFTYESLDTDIATCTSDGVISAVSKGTARIKATLSIPLDDPDYKVATATKTVNFLVTNPTHKVSFYVNGEKTSDTNVPEDDNIVFPSDPSDIGGMHFMGWASDAIIGTTSSASLVDTDNETMGNSDASYYAVFAKKTDLNATFDASDISNLTQDGANLRWTENDTDIELFLQAGSHYTSGSPKTFTVTGGTLHYLEITAPTDFDLTSVIVHFTKNGSTYYKVGSVSTGASVTSVNSTLTSTVSFTSSLNSVKCYSTSNQLRATSIEVSASKIEDYCTTITYIPVTIASTSGFATFYTGYALDFSGLSSEVKAYTASCDGTTVTLEKVDDIPANTGVVLKGIKKTYDVPVIASSSTAKGDLIGNTSAATAYNAYDGYDLYMLALNGEGKAQFTKVTGGSIAAGKAFLKLSSGADARELNVVFADDEPTAIETVKVEKANNEYFNLAGQRVAQPTKGLYIVNGKKVVVK